MIVVRVELWSAITGKKTEIARMHIVNSGDGSQTLGNYTGQTFAGRNSTALDRRVNVRSAGVDGYPRERLHVWNLVGRMLAAMGYAT